MKKLPLPLRLPEKIILRFFQKTTKNHDSQAFEINNKPIVHFDDLE